ncbi:hypothetical protein [Vagococcus jeotgali]|uniref:hypothetical protein n=1 Tax=Vagococcus jeotgali TaxID=3109030 RepID=UPI002DDAE756|nr:hypothetical protein [Vagococcus sp. B2T-5]
MEEEVNFDSMNDIEKALDSIITYHGDPISEQERNMIKVYLSKKYLKQQEDKNDF